MFCFENILHKSKYNFFKGPHPKDWVKCCKTKDCKLQSIYRCREGDHCRRLQCCTGICGKHFNEVRSSQAQVFLKPRGVNDVYRRACKEAEGRGGQTSTDEEQAHSSDSDALPPRGYSSSSSSESDLSANEIWETIDFVNAYV